MPIKDIMHIYECKHCRKRFTMFNNSDGELIFFPENTMWPIHGEFELIDHLKQKHGSKYKLDRLFYDDNSIVIDANYQIDPEGVIAGENVCMQVLR